MTGGASGVRRPWRRCTSMAPICLGVCHWDGEAWVCETCGIRRVGTGQWAAPDVGG